MDDRARTESSWKRSTCRITDGSHEALPDRRELRIHERRWPTARAGAHGSALVVIRAQIRNACLSRTRGGPSRAGPYRWTARSKRWDAGASSAAVSMTTASNRGRREVAASRVGRRPPSADRCSRSRDRSSPGPRSSAPRAAPSRLAPAARSSMRSAGGRRSDSGASSAPADTPAAEGQARAPPPSAIGRNAGKSRPQESAIATDLSNAGNPGLDKSGRAGPSVEGRRLAGTGVLGRLHPIQRDGAAARTAKDRQELIGIDRLDQVGIEACLPRIAPGPALLRNR